MSKSSTPPDPRPLAPGEDYYMESGYMVFTERYHLKRGFCCGSGCRHCPWRGCDKRNIPDKKSK
ncbi:MAG: DUF5522 domain-containing protein [Saprospiraceae bacterium]